MMPPCPRDGRLPLSDTTCPAACEHTYPDARDCNTENDWYCDAEDDRPCEEVAE